MQAAGDSSPNMDMEQLMQVIQYKLCSAFEALLVSKPVQQALQGVDMQQSGI